MKRIYIEKKPEFRSVNEQIKREIKALYNLELEDLRIVNLFYRPREFGQDLLSSLFADASLEVTSGEFEIPQDYRALRTEFQPGQFDQKLTWTKELLKLIGEDDEIYSSKIYLFKGLPEDKWEAVRGFFVNPVESYERALEDFSPAKTREDGDIGYQAQDDIFELDSHDFCQAYNLAMDAADLELIKAYFKEEGRAPMYSELRLLDTYWSDHCRHTTFNTELTEIDFSDNKITEAQEVFDFYENNRGLYTSKPRSLMDLAVFSIRKEKAAGNLKDLEESEEINSCSIERRFGDEDYLVMFKNETHNHPTEIEPYGGAATCLGGCIRDPLSGRSYVYQAMRVTGARNPMDTSVLPGKLPQQIITKRAAQGYASYGNQIGLASGHVKEYYHPGFEAKRMEAGFVIASAKRSHVVRGNPKKGDLLLLLGGATGRDGIGGASGSSKSHQEDVASGAASEVQKGNAPEERKIQRLFRVEEIGPRIVRCNDLGAGGISVAFGEIAPGLEIDIKEVPVKYPEIYPWEILLSESQERMAVVIDSGDLELFKKYARVKGVPLTVIGEVTDQNRFVVKYDGKVLVDIDRDFIERAGAKRTASIKVEGINLDAYPYNNEIENYELRSASQQGLVEMFDSSVGGLNVLSPYGGCRRKSFVDGMVSRLPGLDTDDVTIATQGYDPYLAQWSPFHGAQMAVVQSMAKNLVLGGDIKGQRMTFQEYFEALGSNPSKWAKPFMALLGANSVLHHFNLASIGGKDSMSGSFYWEEGEVHVPPSLISFAVNTGKEADVRSSDFKKAGSELYLYEVKLNDNKTIDLDSAEAAFEGYLMDRDKVLSASVVTLSLRDTVENGCFGNALGAELFEDGSPLGSILVEVEEGVELNGARLVGRVTGGEKILVEGKDYSLAQLLSRKEDYLNPVFEISNPLVSDKSFVKTDETESSKKGDLKVLIPIFPGTCGEDELVKSFEKAGAVVESWVFTTKDLAASFAGLAKKLDEADLLALAGGFSALDEPEGAAKYMELVFRNEQVQAAFNRLIDRKGYVLGLGNGFQALVKLGVFYNSKIEAPEKVTMGFAYNPLGRHQSQMVLTRAMTSTSPWLSRTEDKDYWTLISQGETCFYMSKKDRELLEKRGQIATVYVENPTGSQMDIEGLVSPCGQIFGRLGHDERLGSGLYANVSDGRSMEIFKSVVENARR